MFRSGEKRSRVGRMPENWDWKVGLGGDCARLESGRKKGTSGVKMCYEPGP